VKLVTSAQMRELEQRGIAAGTTLEQMMEQAGLAVAQEVWLTLGSVESRRIVVLAGPGNNGGDGLVAARHLAQWDASVTVYLLTPRPESDANFTRLRESNVAVAMAGDDSGFVALSHALDEADVVVDALLGIGHSRPIAGDLAEVLSHLQSAQRHERPPTVVAVDVPSGVDADSGRADEWAAYAGMTVTFGLAKVGLFMLPGAEHAGRVEVIDIGIPKEATGAIRTELMDSPWVRQRLPVRASAGNKGTFGRVLVVGGSLQYAGAPRLAAEGAYRAGAGLVTIACQASVQTLIAPAIAEATWLPLPEEADSEAQIIVERLDSYDVMLVGPGLGQEPRAQSLVLSVLAATNDRRLAVLVDADALNTLAARGAGSWHAALPPNSVLTPHPGEMARLVGKSVAEVQDDRLNTALQAAAEWKQIVVLKGAHTVVASPDGRVAISPHANPLLASAGTGDVLAGAIAGLLAQGLEPFEAAACGVFLHGLAGEDLGADLGDRGLLASDLPAAIAGATRTVLHGRRPSKRGPTSLADFGSVLTDAGN
jgi:NAD(P)H-hydrate epimerase